MYNEEKRKEKRSHRKVMKEKSVECDTEGKREDRYRLLTLHQSNPNYRYIYYNTEINVHALV